jgi:hypothetical protein
MTESLHSEVVPSHTLLVLGAGLVAAIAVASPRAGERPEPAIVRAPIAVVAPAADVASVVTTAALPAPPTPSFVMRAGTTSYMKLADLAGGDDAEAAGEPRPRHAAPKLYDHDAVYSAVAVVDASDVPRTYRGWLGRAVTVDGACEAKVTGFAVVARLTGDPGYAGLDRETWTAATVLAHGATTLAARLDGCTGTFARDAALPGVVVAQPREDAALAAAARAALIDSAPSRETQREWSDQDQQGAWHAHTDIATGVLRHPRTGVTWVYAHGRGDLGCGGPEVNLWGLFRVDADGKLVAIQLRKLGDIHAIEQLVDIDGDGELEIIGSTWLGGDRVIARASGEELTRLALPFYGCSC